MEDSSLEDWQPVMVSVQTGLDVMKNSPEWFMPQSRGHSPSMNTMCLTGIKREGKTLVDKPLWFSTSAVYCLQKSKERINACQWTPGREGRNSAIWKQWAWEKMCVSFSKQKQYHDYEIWATSPPDHRMVRTESSDPCSTGDMPIYYFIWEYNTKVNSHLQSLCSFSDEEKEMIIHTFICTNKTLRGTIDSDQ